MDEKEKRLPKWAQQELVRLRANIDRLQNQIDMINGDAKTNVFMRDGLEMRPLQSGHEIRLVLGPGLDYVDFNIRSNAYTGPCVQVRTGGTMLILPEASNACCIRNLESVRPRGV